MEYTRPATWDDVKTLVGYLNDAGVEYALVGVMPSPHTDSTASLNMSTFWSTPSADNSRRWIIALSRLPDGAAAELTGETDVFAQDDRYAIRINDEFTVDVMPAIAGSSWEDMKAHVITRQIDGVELRLLDLEGLLKTKRGARPKDRSDASVITAALDAMKADPSR